MHKMHQSATDASDKQDFQVEKCCCCVNKMIVLVDRVTVVSAGYHDK